VSLSADKKAVYEDGPASTQRDAMKKTDMTDEELTRLRAELRLRQKAAMVCVARHSFNISSILIFNIS